MPLPHVIVSMFAVLLLLGAAPDRPDGGGRYQMAPAEGGAFMRLDTQTGTMSICQRKDGQWACAAVPDDRRALQGEIARLEGEKEELKGTVRRLEEQLALPDPEGRQSRQDRPRLRIPSEEEVDKAMDTVERMMRKFRDRIRNFKDGERRSL